MSISIGVLAYNESESISKAIDSIFCQSIFQNHKYGTNRFGFVELVIVPNGCADSTAEVSQEVISEAMVSESVGAWVRARVEPIARPGKENAWNRFVHEFSDPDAHYLILIDGDVELENSYVLETLVQCLEENPSVHVAGGRPVKHIEKKINKSIADRISLGASSLRRGMKGIFAGCLYCGRAEVLRGFSLPSVLMGEDSFVRAIIVTRGFTKHDDASLVRPCEEARVVFEAYTSLPEIVRNKTRRMIEAEINATLYTYLWANSTPERPAGALIMDNDRENPKWSHQLVETEFSGRGFWKIRRHFIYQNFQHLRYHGWCKRLLLFPTALVSIPLNFIALIQANRALARGDVRGLWDKGGGD